VRALFNLFNHGLVIIKLSPKEEGVGNFVEHDEIE